MNQIELLKKAKKKKSLDVSFEIVYGEAKIPAMLSVPDLFEIMEAQEVEYNKKFIKYRKEGFDKEPIDEDKWNEEVSNLERKDRPAYEKTKPNNLAEQMATRHSRLKTILNLMPLYLKNPDNNKLLFPTEDDKEFFQDLVKGDMKLFNLLVGKYVELMNKITNVEETAKNLEKQGSSESGK